MFYSACLGHRSQKIVATKIIKSFNRAPLAYKPTPLTYNRAPPHKTVLLQSLTFLIDGVLL